MNAVNASLDVYSAVISLVLFVYLCLGQRRKDRMDRCFMWLCVFSFTLAVGDLPSWVCEGLGQSWFALAQWAGALTFWLSSILILLAFTVYLVEYISPEVEVDPRFFRVALLLGVLHAAGTILSLFNGMFFTITPDNVYQRGPWFWLSQAIPFLLYALDAAIFIAYRRQLNRQDFAVLASYIALPLLCEAIQIFSAGIAPLCAGVAVALLIIFANIQSAREASMERQEKELAEQRIDIMLSQLQPQFLSAALSTICLQCDHDEQKVQTAVNEFAAFLHANLESLKCSAPIPFEQELTDVKRYMDLAKQHSGDRLCVVYDIQCRDFFLPALTILPIMENAVRHGVLKKERGGTVTLHTRETPESYVITIADDGVGMISASPAASDHTHSSLESVRSRLAAMCGGTMVLQSWWGEGTLVTLRIPKRKRGA